MGQEKLANNNGDSSLESILSMGGGQGEASYFTNSQKQLRFANATRSMVKDLLRTIFSGGIEKSKVFKVADFGCAVGANTLIAMDTIFSSATQCCRDFSLEIPEFQAFFCDLPSNDFNTLLRNLPKKIHPHHGLNANDLNTLSAATPAAPSSRTYFAAAASGSHFNRLFPHRTLHFCHSSTSLHWLSQVPAEVEDKNSCAWNGGHVFPTNPESEKAYQKQFNKDLTSFLRCRGEEMAEGGGLFVCLLGRSSGVPAYLGSFSHYMRNIEIVLNEMLHEGMIEKSVIDNINIPIFTPTVEEVLDVIEKEGSFEIVDIKCEGGISLHENKEASAVEFGKSSERRVRSIFESSISKHVGDQGLVDHVFSRYGKRAQLYYSNTDVYKIDLIGVSLVLKELRGSCLSK